MHYCLVSQNVYLFMEVAKVRGEILELKRLGFNSQLCYVTVDKLYNLLKLYLLYNKCLSHKRYGRKHM